HGRPPAARVAQRAPGERGQGHDAALAVVVGAEDEPDVLDRHDQRDRPEDHRDDAVDVTRRGSHRAVVDGEDGLDGVERAGADVAEDDAERAERQREATAVAGWMAGLRRLALRGVLVLVRGFRHQPQISDSPPPGSTLDVVLTSFSRDCRSWRGRSTGPGSTGRPSWH